MTVVATATSAPIFELLPLSLELNADGDLHLDELAGAVRMRGAFGLMFRRLVCPPNYWARQCRDCEMWRSCVYPAFFEPAPPPDADRLRANYDIPRPYVFSPGEDGRRFDLTLIGRGAEALPYLIVSLRELGATGFGPVRRRFELARVTTTGDASKPVFECSERLVRNPRRVEVPLDIRVPATPSSTMARRTYWFLTPTVLKADGRLESVPSYGTLVKRTRDRVNALATFFGAGPFDWDFRAIGEAAERVSTVKVKGATQIHARYSRRRAQPHDLSGFVGEVTYEGPSNVLEAFDPLLDLVDAIHVGKGAAFGNGKIQRHDLHGCRR